MDERLIREAQDLFDAMWEDIGKQEGSDKVKFPSEAELAERIEEGRRLMDKLLGTDVIESLEETAESEPEEGGREVEIPLLERDQVHGLTVRGYREVKVKDEGDPLTDEQREKLEAYEELLDVLGGS